MPINTPQNPASLFEQPVGTPDALSLRLGEHLRPAQVFTGENLAPRIQQTAARLAPATPAAPAAAVPAPVVPAASSVVAAPPVSAPISSPAPFSPRVTEDRSVSTSRVVMPKEALAAQQRVLQAGQELVKASEAEAQVAKESARAELVYQEEKNRLASDFNAQRQKLEQEGLQEYQQRLAQRDAALKTEQERGYEGFWARRSTGQAVLGALSLALGAIGGAITGKGNSAADIILKAVDDDRDQYQKEVAKNIQLIQQSRLQDGEKLALVQQQVSSLDARKAAALGLVDQQIAQLGLKFADKGIDAKLAATRAQLQGELERENRDFAAKQAATVTSVVEQKAAAYDPSKVYEQEDKIVNEIKSDEQIKRYRALEQTAAQVVDMPVGTPQERNIVAQVASKGVTGNALTDSDLAVLTNEYGYDKNFISKVWNEAVTGGTPLTMEAALALRRTVVQAAKSAKSGISGVVREYHKKAATRLGSAEAADSAMRQAGVFGVLEKPLTREEKQAKLDALDKKAAGK